MWEYILPTVEETIVHLDDLEDRCLLFVSIYCQCIQSLLHNCLCKEAYLTKKHLAL